MRLSKRIVLVSSIISVVTVLCTVLINLNSNCNKTLMILDSIMQNVFAGTIVLVITSLYEYFNEKKILWKIFCFIYKKSSKHLAK